MTAIFNLILNIIIPLLYPKLSYFWCSSSYSPSYFTLFWKSVHFSFFLPLIIIMFTFSITVFKVILCLLCEALGAHNLWAAFVLKDAIIIKFIIISSIIAIWLAQRQLQMAVCYHKWHNKDVFVSDSHTSSFQQQPCKWIIYGANDSSTIHLWIPHTDRCKWRSSVCMFILKNVQSVKTLPAHSLSS